MTKEFATLQAYGANLSRDAAMEFYNMALDRVIDGIYCLDEAGLQSHITHLINSANGVDPSGKIDFKNEEANRLFSGKLSASILCVSLSPFKMGNLPSEFLFLIICIYYMLMLCCIYTYLCCCRV